MSEAERGTWRDAHRRANAALAERLGRAFDGLDRWFEADPDLLAFRPRPGSWTATEILEHVALTNRFLLLLIAKIHDRALRAVEGGEPFPAAPPDVERIAALADDGRPWTNPEHMTPRGESAPDEVRRRLAEQRAACLARLARLPAGEGTLHRIRMSRVPGDDRLDLYQYLEVVTSHAHRHLGQLARNERAFRTSRPR